MRSFDSTWCPAALLWRRDEKDGADGDVCCPQKASIDFCTPPNLLISLVHHVTCFFCEESRLTDTYNTDAEQPLILVSNNPEGTGAFNMALDHYLFENAYTLGDSIWRLYLWNPPAVSIGRNQKLEQAVNLETVKRENLPLVRRPTGGRAIWHCGDVCFTHAGVTPGQADSVKAFKSDYIRAASLIVRFLGALGVDAGISPGQPGGSALHGPFKSPCFQCSGRFEVTVSGKKIAGIAQYRSGDRYLIQGSIRLEVIDPLNADLFFTRAEEGRIAFEDFVATVTSIDEELSWKTSWSELREAFCTALATSGETVVDPLESGSAIELPAVAKLETGIYSKTLIER